MNETTKDEVRTAVRDQYGQVARSETRAGCAPACCGHIAQDVRGRVIGCEPRADGRLPGSCCA